MLKQCFEQDIIPIIIDVDNSDDYKMSLEYAQLTGDKTSFSQVIRRCQNRFSDKKIVKDTLESMRRMDLF